MLVPGAEILFRGKRALLTVNGTDICFADQSISLPGEAHDLTAAVRSHLWQLATKEFVPRVFELAARHGISIKRVLVRNQRTRWGSCSVYRTISLNWRLIHAPAFVSDYLMLHELMHLREMNHSDKFWKHVAAVCARYTEAEQWLDDHDHLLRQG